MLVVLQAFLATVAPDVVVPNYATEHDGSMTIRLLPRTSGAADIWLQMSEGGGYVTVILAEFGVLELVAPVTHLDETLSFNYLRLLELLLKAAAQGDVVQIAEPAPQRVRTETIVNLGTRLLRLEDYDQSRTLAQPAIQKFAAWT